MTQGVDGGGMRGERGEAVVLALCMALLTASGWLGELMGDPAFPARPSWASWLADGAVCIAYLAFVLFHARVDRLWDGMMRASRSPRGLAALLLALGVVGAACRGLSCVVGAVGPVAAGVGLAVYEGCRAVLLMAVLCACAWRVPRWAPLAFPAGYALAAALVFVFRALPASVVVAVAPAVFFTAALLMAIFVKRMPLSGASAAEIQADAGDAGAARAAGGAQLGSGTAPGAPGAALQLCADDVADYGGDAVLSQGAAAGSGLPGQTRAPGRWTFPVRPVVLMCAYAFAFRFSISLSEGPNPYGMLGMLLVSLVALAVPLARRSFYDAGFLYRMALPLMVAGLVCLAFLGEGRTVAVLFSNSGNVAFALFMYVTLATLCNRYAVSPAWMFGIVQLASEVASDAGLAAGMAFTAAYPVGSPQADLVMCCMVVGVTVVSTVVFNDSAVARSFGIVPVGEKPPASPGGEGAPGEGHGRAAGPAAAMSYSERIVWECTQVARRYGLTLREQEVLELMVQGLSVPDVAQRAGVSYGTAKTHVNHIYRKLDVHSREEALALMRRELG